LPYDPTDFEGVIMKELVGAALILLSTLGCEISPVVSAPMDAPGMRYSDCDRAAEDYCEHAVKARRSEMDACVAEHRLKCLSSGAKASAVPRTSS
jgi:hypothetical protein